MATPGFFNANQYRDYPFVTRLSPIEHDGMSEGENTDPGITALHYRSFTALWLGGAQLIVPTAWVLDLPQSCVVDFGAIIRPSATYRVGFHSVYLTSITRNGTLFTFRFVLSSMSATYAIDFVVDSDYELEFYTQWKDSPVLAQVDTGIHSCDDAPVWSAFLVTGDLSPLFPMIPDGASLIFVTDLWKIMPGRIQNLVGSQVQSIAIANTQRATVMPSAGCGNSSIGAEDTLIANVVDICIVGDVMFHEGYNCSLRHDLRENAIVIAAGVGAGAGQVCEEVPRFEDEPKPDGSPYYSGGPKCEDIVKYINGINSPDFKIIAGPGFIVAADPELPNTLVIERSLNASIICADLTLDSESLTSSSLSISYPPIIDPGPKG